MKKKKAFWAMLLSAAMVSSNVTPAFAGELTDFSYETMEAEETEGQISGMLPVETNENSQGISEQLPEEIMDSNQIMSVPEATGVPKEEDEPTVTPEVNQSERSTEEADETEETLIDGSQDRALEEITNEMPEETPDDDNTDGKFVISGQKIQEVRAGQEGNYYDIADVYADDEGNVQGVVINTYREGDGSDAVPVDTVCWYAEDGAWTVVDGEEEYYIEAGVYALYGIREWNIQTVNEVSIGKGGYVLDAANRKWAYYLTAEDVKNPSILHEAWTDVEDINLPAAMFIGAQGELSLHAGLRTIDGAQYYLNKDGTMVTDGEQTIDGVVYKFGSDGKCTGSYTSVEAGWVERPDGFYWRQEDGTILRTGGWQVLNGQRYFLKYTSGRRASGWVTWSKGKYYLDPETGVVVTGMKEIDGQYYYFNPTGNTPGKMHTGWKTIDGKKYYFQSNGTRKKGWLTLNGRKYYFEKDGTQTYGWRSISGKKYYFDLKNGFMRIGWLTIGSNKYYMEKDGSQHTGFRSIGGKKYYFVPKTGIMKKGWLTLNGKKYYFEVDGAMRYGWRSLGGKMYYFAQGTGIMQTGWLTIGSDRYYLNTDGSRCSGMMQIDGKSYYFKTDGKLLTNKNVYSINGTYYSVAADGVLSSLSKAEGLAAQKLDEIGWNLYAAFQWSSGQTGKFYYYRNSDTVPAGYTEADYYAIYGFENNRGDCYVMACTFYQMAKLLGYDVHFVKGKVPLARGGWGPHGWCEIDTNGSTYVCDPDFTWDEGRNGYMITYGTPGTWVYSSYYRVN